MSFECADRHALVYGSGHLPDQNRTLFGKTDNWNLKNEQHHSVQECPWSYVPRFTFYGLNVPNQEILSELGEVYGKAVISLSAVHKWIAYIDGWHTELVDLCRSGPAVQ
jgi:hypothetical protein